MKKHVGNVGVDAGMVWIGDPCYIMHKEGEQKYKTIGKDWGEFCKLLDRDEYPTIKSFNYDVGHEGLGVCLSSGLGDGLYPVVAEVREVGDWGKRVLNAKITFIKDEEKLAVCYGEEMTASNLVAYLGDELIGGKITIDPESELNYEVTGLFPEEFNPNVVMQVRRLSDGKEIGVFHCESVTLIQPK